MKKQIPAIILAIVAIGLGAALYSANQQIEQLEKQLAEAPAACVADAQPALVEPVEPVEVEVVETTPAPVISAAQDPVSAPVAPKEEEAPSGQRMMKNIAKMMDNPAMNKMMEASQRGVIGAMYGNLAVDLNLTEEEEKYFMELLLLRQMSQVNAGMKLMSGELSDEEKEAITKEMKEVRELVKTEMKAFLNDEDDYNEFEFFEETMGERMMLSQAEASLAGTTDAFSDETYRGLLEMMYDEKQNFDYNTDFQDETNMDMSAERFSKTNIDNFGTDMDRLNENMFTKAQNILTSEQFSAFKDAVKTTTDMQKSQMNMAAQMFGGGK